MPIPATPQNAQNPGNSFPFDLVLFDFDGTLADSYAAIAASVNHVRQRFQMPTMPVEEIKRFVGRGAHHLLSHTVPGVDGDTAFALYREHHPQVLLSGTELLEGARDVLHWLQNSGVGCGICSNKPVQFTRELVQGLGIATLFQVVLGPEDVVARKPAPDMVLEAMKRTARAPARTLYVGDMSVDIQTGRGAGVTVWCVATGSETWDEIEQASPDQLFRDMVDLGRSLRDSFGEPRHPGKP